MATVRFVVPGKPMGKQAARASSGIVYTSAATREEMGGIKYIASLAMEGAAPFLGAVELRLCAWMAVPRSWSKKKRAAAIAGELRPVTKPDWDNVGKMLDAIKGIVWADDAQVTDVHLFKRYAEVPRVVVEVIEIDQHAAGN